MKEFRNRLRLALMRAFCISVMVGAGAIAWMFSESPCTAAQGFLMGLCVWAVTFFVMAKHILFGKHSLREVREQMLAIREARVKALRELEAHKLRQAAIKAMTESDEESQNR